MQKLKETAGLGNLEFWVNWNVNLKKNPLWPFLMMRKTCSIHILKSCERKQVLQTA